METFCSVIGKSRKKDFTNHISLSLTYDDDDDDDDDDDYDI